MSQYVEVVESQFTMPAGNLQGAARALRGWSMEPETCLATYPCTEDKNYTPIKELRFYFDQMECEITQNDEDDIIDLTFAGDLRAYRIMDRWLAVLAPYVEDGSYLVTFTEGPDAFDCYFLHGGKVHCFPQRNHLPKFEKAVRC